MTIQQAVNQAITHFRAGQLAEAADICRHVVAQQPDNVDALNLLGLVARLTGHPRAAMELFAKAVTLRPDVAELHCHLGMALTGTGQVDEAITSLGQALAINPNYPEALCNLADALCVKGRWNEAIPLYEKSESIKPHDAAALRNYATALMKLGQWEKSIRYAQASLAMEPNHGPPHVTIGVCARALGDIQRSADEYRAALKIEPTNIEAINNLANVERETGNIPKAIELYRQALSTAPHRADIDSNRVYAMHYDATYDSQTLSRELRGWAQRHADPLKHKIRPHENDRAPDRRLRIGYVSPDLRGHVVGYSLLPLLRHHDHQSFEIFAYSAATRIDETTVALRACCDQWRDIQFLSDEQAADMIRTDKIDILLDLTLHMAHNRLLLFARKPAPIQVTYLGYCSTTGLATIDYRLSDPHLDPADVDLSCYTEKTARLPRTYWCYQPLAEPPIHPAPATANGYITYGCLNSFAKVTPQTLDVWREILQASPRSRLILHCPQGAHRNGVLEKLGVDASRVEFVGFQHWPQYIQTYDRIDVALDPFPYGGGITTMDGLWMGVPVITLRGTTAVGRGGASILSNLGLPELIAGTETEYIERAAQAERWIELRPGLRDRMRTSPLTDAPAFARDIETEYRRMWTQWTQPT